MTSFGDRSRSAEGARVRTGTSLFTFPAVARPRGFPEGDRMIPQDDTHAAVKGILIGLTLAAGLYLCAALALVVVIGGGR